MFQFEPPSPVNPTALLPKVFGMEEDDLRKEAR
jgi:hypothetical protein